MKNELTSLGSRVVFCAVVMSLASTAFAGGRGGTRGQFRPIQRPGAALAAQATIRDDARVSGNTFNPSRNNGVDRFQGLISSPEKR